jgi:prevent-host-death family protein
MAGANEAVEGCPTITVGKLRQNPTEMVHAVRQGAVCVLTDRGVPMGRIVPFRPRQRWVAAQDAKSLLSEPAGSTWSADLRQARDAEALRDPWAAPAGDRERAQG